MQTEQKQTKTFIFILTSKLMVGRCLTKHSSHLLDISSILWISPFSELGLVFIFLRQNNINKKIICSSFYFPSSMVLNAMQVLYTVASGLTVRFLHYIKCLNSSGLCYWGCGHKGSSLWPIAELYGHNWKKVSEVESFLTSFITSPGKK